MTVSAIWNRWYYTSNAALSPQFCTISVEPKAHSWLLNPTLISPNSGDILTTREYQVGLTCMALSPFAFLTPTVLKFLVRKIQLSKNHVKFSLGFKGGGEGLSKLLI